MYRMKHNSYNKILLFWFYRIIQNSYINILINSSIENPKQTGLFKSISVFLISISNNFL